MATSRSSASCVASLKLGREAPSHNQEINDDDICDVLRFFRIIHMLWNTPT